MIDRETVILQLNAIVRELLSMNDEVFQKHINKDNFEIKFAHFLTQQPAKINTIISIKKTLVDF